MSDKPGKFSPLNATTTSQSLGTLLKSARDIMRKDKGWNGDLDCLPMLKWIMFLKFLNDRELQREHEARLAGAKFEAAIEKPYRWLKCLQAETAAELDALLPSILDKAFKGEL